MALVLTGIRAVHSGLTAFVALVVAELGGTGHRNGWNGFGDVVWNTVSLPKFWNPNVVELTSECSIQSSYIRSLLNSKHDVPGHLSDVPTRQHVAETVWDDDEARSDREGAQWLHGLIGC